MEDYPYFKLPLILTWYWVVGVILYALEASGCLNVKIPVTRRRFFALWLLCLFFTAAPLLLLLYDIPLSFIWGIASWTVAKCLLLIIVIKRSLASAKGKCLFFSYFLLLLLAESIEIFSFPILAALSVLCLLTPSQKIDEETKPT